MPRAGAGLAGAFGAGVLVSMALLAGADTTRPLREAECGVGSAARVRTTLYFGLGRPQGMVSELEWQIFLRDEVTPRFPQGLTVWEAQGQWQSQAGIGHERTKVLLLVHPDAPAAHEAIQVLIGRYRKAFEQESVLWETSRVCAVL